MPRRPALEEIVLVSDFELTPGLVLAMWSGGMAAGAAFVARWRIVKPLFFWVTIGATLLVGAGAAVGGGWLARTGIVALIVALLLAKRPTLLASALAVGAVCLVGSAAVQGGVLAAVTGAVALGGATDEMLLGHWYLVNPKMPRWALRKLDIAGLVGLGGDGLLIVVAAGGDLDNVVGWAFVALASISVLLMVGVWFSLKEPSYPGVMAATGLSYLAVLTALGAVVAGRSLLGDASNLLAVVSSGNLAP